MSEIIYVQLLNEGTKVYRPVSATKVKDNIYRIDGEDIYDGEDEVWEFLPGSLVKVGKKLLQGDFVMVAIENAPD
jgi:hypothetical protein